MPLAQELAKRIHALRFEDLPTAAIHWSKVAILDTVGVMLAGSVQESAKILNRVVVPTAADGPCVVFGTRMRTNALDAALANGTAGHALDYDDSNYQMLGHPSVALLPALFAAAETTGASGRDFLLAYVVGFETVGRVGLGVAPYQYALGWHPTTTIGIFGAVAGCSVLLGLSESQTAGALGMAVSMAAGVKSNFGTMTKPLHVGLSSRNALLAVQLAREGFTASPEAFEHRQGFLSVFNGKGNYDISKILDRWASPLCILDLGVSQKRFPCCYACLAPIDGILNLTKQHGLTPEKVAKIECFVHPVRMPHIDVPDPQSDLDAKFSVHYCLARALVDGELTIEHFEGGSYKEPKVQAIMKRISLAAYENDDNIMGSKIRVTTTGGQILNAAVGKAYGASYQHALPPEFIKEKFENCVSRVLPSLSTGKLYAALEALENLRDIKDLTALATAGHRSVGKEIARHA